MCLSTSVLKGRDLLLEKNVQTWNRFPTILRFENETLLNSGSGVQIVHIWKYSDNGELVAKRTVDRAEDELSKANC